MRRVLELFEVPTGNPDLTESQLRAFTRQLPLLYLILIANTVFVSFTHYAIAPAYLTLLIPGLLTLACLVRFYGWRKLAYREVGYEEALGRLRETVRLVVMLGLGFAGWGLAMTSYGDAYQRMHVVFYVSITTIACVFCLMHVRAAALSLSLIVVVPMTLFFATRGEPVLAAVAANFLLATGTMLVIVFTHYRDFAQLIDQRRALREKQAETQRLSDENMRLALIDSLTGMANRRSFLTAIEKAIIDCGKHPGRVCAVGLIDLDGFKSVNDLYGHATGDELLVEASRRMQEMTGWQVRFARLGGDEFGVMLHGILATEDVADFGQALCERLRLPYVLSHISVDVSASTGFAIYPEAGTTATRLLEHADYALYQAKQKSTGAAVIFNGEHAYNIKWLNQIDHALRNADLERELSLAYQRIVEPKTGAIRAVEALARWHSPILGHVSPTAFIKAAERSDLINRITVVLFRQALAEAATLPPDILLSFNLSARDIASPETILKLLALVMNGPVPPHRIVFEVTETAVMADFTQAVKSLTVLRGVGARVALDDFGSGYSSLGYVHRLPLDEIKIDGAFTADLLADAKVRNIFKTIVDLSHNLGITCVAEGVETAEQAEFIAGFGCDLAQGYYYGRPVRVAVDPGRAVRLQPDRVQFDLVLQGR